MDYQVIQGWLGLAPGQWPPDPYTLLGIKPGETDVRRIEQRAQERLAKVRCYQLSHPEQATEAMNRLAQAFLQVTETTQPHPLPAQEEKAKEVPHPPPLKNVGEESLPQAVAKNGAKADWREAPPPVRVSAPSQAPPVLAPTPTENNGTPAPASPPPPPPRVKGGTEGGLKGGTEGGLKGGTEGGLKGETEEVLEPQPPTPPPAPPPDPWEEMASRSWAAKTGLGTLTALLERIDLTRQLLWAWEQAGTFLGNPQRPLSKPAEEIELTRRLDKLAELMEDFPPLLGQPGQPGYRVVALARLQMTAPMFKNFDVEQRQALARDWEAGLALLRHHHRFLLHELKRTRRLGWLRLGLRAVWRTVRDYPVYCLYGLLGLAFLGVLLLYLHIFFAL